MILSQISYLDCLVFIIFLAPQLLLRVNLFELLVCVVKALPFFCKGVFSTCSVYVLMHCSIQTTLRLHF